MTPSPERKVLLQVREAVEDLRQTARGFGPEQAGQRRMAQRVLSQIDEWLDDGESWSEDDIDPGLKA